MALGAVWGLWGSCCYRWADYFATMGTVDIVDTVAPLSPGAVVEDCHCLSVGLGVYLD